VTYDVPNKANKGVINMTEMNKWETIKGAAGKTVQWTRSVITPKRIKKCVTILVLLAVVGGVGSLGAMKVKAQRRVAEDTARTEMLQKVAAQQNRSVLSTDEVKRQVADLLGADPDTLNFERISLSDKQKDFGKDRKRFEKRDRDKEDKREDKKDDKRENRKERRSGDNDRPGKDNRPGAQQRDFNRGPGKAGQGNQSGRGPGMAGLGMMPGQPVPNAAAPNAAAPNAVAPNAAAPQQQAPAADGSTAQNAEVPNAALQAPAAPLPLMGNVPQGPFGVPGLRRNGQQPLVYNVSAVKDGMTYRLALDAETGKVLGSKVHQTSLLERFLF
jgi:hypothetical protein